MLPFFLVNNAGPVLERIRLVRRLNLLLDGHAAIDVDAKGVRVLDVARLVREELPVGKGQTDLVHVLGVGRELGRGVVLCRVDSPLLELHELAVCLIDPIGVAVGPLGRAVGLRASIAMD